MTLIKWLFVCVFVVLLFGVVWIRGGDRTKFDDNFQSLVEKESQQKSKQQVEAAAETAQVAVQREKTGQSDGADFVRPAIPELSEFTWENTRKWNLPLHNPPIASRQDAVAFMEPDDVVIGVLVGGRARAYPWFVLANYHAANDFIDDTPIIVNFCEACNGVAAFFANAGTTTLDFRPLGVKNGTWYAVDFQTGSHWLPFSGKAFEGPLKGEQLERIPCFFSTWREWADDHPYTTVVLGNEEMRRREHGAISYMANENNFNPALLKRILDPAPNPRRDWLETYDLVFGLYSDDGKAAIAYPLNELKKSEMPIQTDFDGQPILIAIKDQFQVSALIRKLGDIELSLEVTNEEPFVMTDQLGNDWDIWGRALAGPNHPASLQPADGYLTKWYEWIENYPRSELYPDQMRGDTELSSDPN